jgi:hypothetical protein
VLGGSCIAARSLAAAETQGCGRNAEGWWRGACCRMLVAVLHRIAPVACTPACRRYVHERAQRPWSVEVEAKLEPFEPLLPRCNELLVQFA